jgi:hypothetical protein
MAKVLGESGRYVSQEAGKREWRMLAVTLVVVGIVAWISGFLFGSLFHRTLFWVGLLVNSLALLTMLVLQRWAKRQIDTLNKQRKDMWKGADGEATVGLRLGDFPDSFRVLNDLTTPFGNLDHVVVGPTGVFVLDTKNWRGIVSADGKGELLVNGKPTDKPYMRYFTARIMDVKDKVKLLAPGQDPFFQGVFVFPSARVEANWGTTRNIHCIRDEQLFSYIVENKMRKLKEPEVDKIAQAFLALAHMDKDFTAKATGRDNRAPERICM